MTRKLLARRLHAHSLSRPRFRRPEKAVRWLGAVQAQDYANSLWGIGLRLGETTAARVEQAISDKSIVRTWFMRGTLHFVAAEDLRWMIRLLAPRMRRLVEGVSTTHGLGLDEMLLTKTNTALARALQGGHGLDRRELAAVLGRAGIPAQGVALSLILQRAQADGLICYGPRRGKQFTFVLVEEWLPPGRALEGEEARSELALRYFTSHGPAALRDFIWWTGLPAAEARQAFESVRSSLESETRAGETFWFSPGEPLETVADAILLPNYDEYTVGYKDRSALLATARRTSQQTFADSIVLNPAMLLDGQAVGTWKRTITRQGVLIHLSPFFPLGKDASCAFERAAERYAAFLELPQLSA